MGMYPPDWGGNVEEVEGVGRVSGYASLTRPTPIPKPERIYDLSLDELMKR